MRYALTQPVVFQDKSVTSPTTGWGVYCYLFRRYTPLYAIATPDYDAVSFPVHEVLRRAHS